MILKASQRGGAMQLAAHLLRNDENDHVELHEVKGFVADDLSGALREAYAISKGTRCRQFLFSLSLSPPETEHVPVTVFEQALADIEARLGLAGQPRVVVFHEKHGRRHAHCVWSRIDADRMRAINLSHFKLKLRDASRALFIEHQWHMPPGLVKSAERDPRNFSRTEWAQAKRAEHDPAALKETFQDCWAISDSRKAFAAALAARGLYLARGDRRGFVAVDLKGEVFAVAKWTGLRTKAIEARLGDPDELPSVTDTKAMIADLLKGVLGRHLAETIADHRDRVAPLKERLATLRAAQREQRRVWHARQAAQAEAEARARAARFRRGMRGWWDAVTGRQAQIRRENEADALAAAARAAQERDALVQRQLQARRDVQGELKAVCRAFDHEVLAVYHELAQLAETTETAVEGGTARCGRRPRRNASPGPHL